MTVLSAQQIHQYALQAGLNESQATIATAIALAESGGRTDAINPGNGTTDIEYSVGLWQINLLAHPGYTQADMENPAQNAYAMSAISNSGTNWNPWGTYTSGAYKQFLSQSGLPGSSTPNAGGGVPTGSSVPFVGPLIDWLNQVTGQFQGVLDWFTNPTRIIKLVVGMILVGVATAMLAIPDVSKYAGKYGKYFTGGGTKHGKT